MKKILLSILSVLFAGGAFAQEDASVLTQQILEKTINRGTEVLKDESMDFSEKMAEFERLLKTCCHTDLMAKLVLGKSGWSKLSEEEHPEFIDAFIQMVTRSYYSKLDMADVSSVEIIYETNNAISPVKRLLTTTVADDDQSYSVEYKFALIKGEWGVYDLVIEGISLLASYRSEYADYLVSHTGAELIQMLRDKAAEAEADDLQNGADVTQKEGEAPAAANDDPEKD